MLLPAAAVTWLIVSVLVFIAEHPLLTAAFAVVLAGGTYAIVRALHARTVSVWRGPFRPFTVSPVFAGS
jgi:hypothetical protein